jgi:hypothetical protein
MQVDVGGTLGFHSSSSICLLRTVADATHTPILQVHYHLVIRRDLDEISAGVRT